MHDSVSERSTVREGDMTDEAPDSSGHDKEAEIYW